MKSWTDVKPDGELPEMAVRVLVETDEGSILFGRRVMHGEGWRWIDDQSCPIRGVKCWTFVVARGETE